MRAFALVLPWVLLAEPAANPFAGRWNFTLETPGGTRAIWLKVTGSSGAPEVWFQPTGGNVYQVKDFKLAGSRLELKLSGNSSLELTAVPGRVQGTLRRGDNPVAVTGFPAPKLDRPAPRAWSTPEPLFNGRDLTGWEPIGDPASSHWTVRNGYLTNLAKGANLKSTRKFNDFRLHFEVKCPDRANSGIYLRGRYEVQLEYEPASANPPERGMGSIYGRIAPTSSVTARRGEWEVFDVTLVGRTLTMVRNGVTIVGRQEIEGITGGALDANEAEPGPFYIQGDHTGRLEFRNITISIPKR